MSMTRTQALLVLALLDVADAHAPENDWEVEVVKRGKRGKRVTYDLYTWVDDEDE